MEPNREYKEKNRGTKNFNGIKGTFRALGSRNYRLFFGGQTISLIGTWMQKVALSWMVYRLTGSVMLLGVVGFAGQIPTFLVSPFAGVVADRYSRYRILLITQMLSLVQATILAALVLANMIAIWQIIVLSLVLGFINAFDTPSRQAFVIEMIEKKEDLGNAIALNSSMVNVARLIGPSVAGVLIATVGEGVCFLFNAVSFLAVLASLIAMKIKPIKREISHTNVLHGLKEGFDYSFGSVPIRSVLLLLALVSLMGMPYMVLMPVFAKDILGGGPHTLGFLMASTGVGALVGALYLASLKRARGLEKTIPKAAALFGVALIVFSQSRNLWLSFALLFLAGLGLILEMASSNTVLQTIVEDGKRARVMGFFTMAFLGMAPFGNLLAGAIAAKIGAPSTLLISGVSCIIGAILFTKTLPHFGDITAVKVSPGGIPMA